MPQQFDLFSNLLVEETFDPIPKIEGLSYVASFLDANAQEQILRDVDSMPWRADLKRRVQHYGYRYDYKARRIDSSMRLGPLPSWSSPIAEKLVAKGLFTSRPDQLIVNEYEPGQGISAHIDCEPCFGDAIAMISLGWAYEMDFTHQVTRESKPILLETGSALVVSGEARYQWLHAIKPRRSDRGIRRERRVSLTFRSVVLT